MRVFVVTLVLRLVRAFSRLFYTVEEEWLNDDLPPERRWDPYRLVVILNHTSLFEFLYSAVVPDRFLRRMARHGVVPIAEKTVKRPIVGPFWRLIAGQVVPITRERDETWSQVVESVGPEAMVIILPEGRMKRATGLDQQGRPLVVRAGIADLLGAMDGGRMLIAYSQGLHHVQVPDKTLPKLFKTIRIKFEVLDIAEFRRIHEVEGEGPRRFRRRVVEDLTRRRDLHCGDQAAPE